METLRPTPGATRGGAPTVKTIPVRKAATIRPTAIVIVIYQYSNCCC